MESAGLATTEATLPSGNVVVTARRVQALAFSVHFQPCLNGTSIGIVREGESIRDGCPVSVYGKRLTRQQFFQHYSPRSEAAGYSEALQAEIERHRPPPEFDPDGLAYAIRNAAEHPEFAERLTELLVETYGIESAMSLIEGMEAIAATKPETGG